MVKNSKLNYKKIERKDKGKKNQNEYDAHMQLVWKVMDPSMTKMLRRYF